MHKNFKRIVLILMVLVISFSLVSLALAAPPDHASNKAEKTNEDKGTPPGLVDKGGLPPGLHGRTYDQLPPGIRNNPNFQEAVNRLKQAANDQEPGFFIVGSEYIIIPEEGEAAQSKGYKAILRDEDGNEIEVTASWSLENGQTGVNIDVDGILTVSAAAEEDSTVTVIADYTAGEGDAEVDYTATLAVTLYKPAINSIEIAGDACVALEGTETSVQRAYTAVIKDQNGQIMDDSALTWSELTWSLADYGWTLQFDAGSVTVSIADLPGPGEEITFTLRAEYLVEATVSISTALEVVVYHPVVDDILIYGAAEVALPAKGEVTREDYTTVALDQYGQEMDINLIWFLDDGVAGASISDGTLTITDEAESGMEFWLWVYSDDPQTANYGFEVTVVGDALEETA